jgi:fructose-bisphosphate aldolase, class II
LTITSIKTELNRALHVGYAVALFDVFDQYGVDGIFDAVEEKHAPVIFGIYSGSKVFQRNAKAFVAYIRTRAEGVSYPISIMLDHGSNVEQCLFALECGFTDVMYDGSKLALKENIEDTKRVVAAARCCGAAVEAELGHVSSGSNYATFGGQRIGFTDPNQVEEFVSETGVDFLAVAFGNAHGNYYGEPCLDLNLLREIRKRTSIPLVMHGGTGLEDKQYQEIISAGVSKINFFTVVLNEATKRMVSAARSENPNMFQISEQMQTAYREISSHYFDVLSTSGRA